MRIYSVSIRFLSFMNQLKLYHWATLSYARHKASDALQQALAPLVDQFVEVYLGKRGHSALAQGVRAPFQHTMQVLTEDTIALYARGFRAFLTRLPLQRREDAELANLRDEMVAHVNQFLYLLELQ